MKAAVFTAPHEINVQDVPKPTIDPHEVVIEVEACGLCGTDLKINAGGYDAVYPVIAGHEFSGTIRQVGDEVDHLNVGDTVAVNPNTPCRHCDYCYRGRFHLCEDMTACGVTYNGGFAEYCKVAAELALPVSDDLPLNLWAMMEPVSCCLHGIDQAEITAGDRIVILGGGSIGLMLLQLARHAGAGRIIVSEPKQYKRELAEQLGADETINPAAIDGDITDAVHALTDDGADIAIEAAGLEVTARSVLPLVRGGGTVLFFGVCPQDVEVPIKPYDIFHHEITIKGSYTNPLTDSRALRLIRNGRVQLQPLLSHQFALDDIADGIAAVAAGETVKAQVVP